jgi:predicted esterase
LDFGDYFLKILHETLEMKWQFRSHAELTGIIRRVDAPQSIILLLHGLGQRGKRIYRQLLPFLPENALIIAPNAPFPIPREKEGKIDFGHSWYFYNKFEKTYFVTHELSSCWLKSLVELENLAALPVTIIGFSQGGYLAPHVAKYLKETRLVLGLCCEFRSHMIDHNLQVPLIGIHGESDDIVSPISAGLEIERLKEKGLQADFHTVPETGHEINKEMGQIIKFQLEKYGKRDL